MPLVNGILSNTLLYVSPQINQICCIKSFYSGIFRYCCRARFCDSLLLNVRFELTVYYYLKKINVFSIIIIIIFIFLN